jgi:hypothetical protein
VDDGSGSFCNKDTGKCTQCKTQWAGDYCEIGCKHVCANGGTCFETKSNTSHSANTAKCVCVEHFTNGDSGGCGECDDGYYGKSCKQCGTCVHGNCMDGIQNNGHCDCTTLFFNGRQCDQFSNTGTGVLAAIVGSFSLLGLLCLAPWHTKVRII